jgi:hypothetical protein
LLFHLGHVHGTKKNSNRMTVVYRREAEFRNRVSKFPWISVSWAQLVNNISLSICQ